MHVSPKPTKSHCSYLDISISPKSSEKSGDFPDLTLAQYNLKKWYFWLINKGKKVLGDEKRV